MFNWNPHSTSFGRNFWPKKNSSIFGPDLFLVDPVGKEWSILMTGFGAMYGERDVNGDSRNAIGFFPPMSARTD
jgi:hypothetical protein